MKDNTFPPLSADLFSPAKVNLFLEVTGKRPDGYHDLATLFAKLNFGDDIKIALEPAGETSVEMSITGPLAGKLEADNKNLVWRAVEKFSSEFNIPMHVKIVLDKRIPMGAGLGGGSSNAGTVLKFLAKSFDIPVDKVVPMAAKLGADVPLFLYDDTFMIGRGIGEKLTPVEANIEMPWVVVAYPNVHVSTKEIFSNFKLARRGEILTSLSKLDRITKSFKEGQSLSEWGGLVFNRLEDCVFPLCKVVAELKGYFECLSVRYVLMSGSGSAVFALVSNRAAARDLAEKLGPQIHVCNTHFGGHKQ
ncbi:4-diphosphocytidyl-2-C-methyl-D-erythritol kinase [Parelusimicrobium proximum]|uniref:4-(cytidine 5'-diphospho)-2-C-methyl-D-erythritol kinase n=1 Tax=Parelusimicrobium proximum TaxID=3228953 RepID=UPI003D16B1AB